MAYLVTTYGIYDGTKTGIGQKTGKPWTAYQFRIPEDINGIQASPEQMRASNLSLFPSQKPNCDFSQLIPGQKYDLKLTFSTTGKTDLVSYQERKQ